MNEEETVKIIERYFARKAKEDGAKIVTNITVNDRYQLTLERGASSTKGQMGYKVSAKGDSLADVVSDVRKLQDEAEERANG